MYQYRKIELQDIDAILNACSRSHFDYQEHRFLTDDQLSQYARNTLQGMISKESTVGFLLYDNDILLGAIIASKNDFDSEMFTLCCYQISKLFIFSNDVDQLGIIGERLLKVLEEQLKKVYSEIHLSVGLNNNFQNMDGIFNTLTRFNFRYLHTLLTFGSIKNVNKETVLPSQDTIIIREATSEDALQVAQLAKKSFRFSRFHLDPFLDNEKSSILLENSAKNSILKGYADVMFVAEIDSKIVGYYSCKKRFIKEFNQTIANIGVSAVDSNYRGLGIFGKLDDYISHWCFQNAQFAEMGTYLANYPVHKTWINKGFKLVRGTHQFSKLIQSSQLKNNLVNE